MNVVVVMMPVGAGFPAEGVFCATLVVQHPVNDAFIQKRT
jgi:hypothetical protein